MLYAPQLLGVHSPSPTQPCCALVYRWTWRNGTAGWVDGANVPAHQCLLAQGGGPVTAEMPGFMSGCQFGTVCNQSLPRNPNQTTVSAPSPSLAAKCAAIHQRGLEFAGNYTAMLVNLHNVFNGDPDGLFETIMQMTTLKSLAIGLMTTADPRISVNTMGVGPPWEFIPAASQYEARGRLARPIIAGAPVARSRASGCPLHHRHPQT